jgi:lysophospholipid acyltransferase (LPLAT)-like uncharacterized protein
MSSLHLKDKLKYGLLALLLQTVVVPFLRWVRWGWRAKTRVSVDPATASLLQQGQPVLFAVWHGEMFVMLLPLGLPATTALLISQSRDGEFITQVARGLGFTHFIRGGHQRGGAKAALAIQRLLTRRKHSVLVFADGPRGPRHTIKKGTVKLAAQAGVPIIPVGGGAPHLLFTMNKSWDAYQGPWPFSSVRAHLGTPVWVDEAVLSDTSALTTTCEQVNQAIKTASQQALQG